MNLKYRLPVDAVKTFPFLTFFPSKKKKTAFNFFFRFSRFPAGTWFRYFCLIFFTKIEKKVFSFLLREFRNGALLYSFDCLCVCVFVYSCGNCITRQKITTNREGTRKSKTGINTEKRRRLETNFADPPTSTTTFRRRPGYSE